MTLRLPPRATSALVLTAALGGATLARGDGGAQMVGPGALKYSPETQTGRPGDDEPKSPQQAEAEAPTPVRVAMEPAPPLTAAETIRINQLRGRLAELDRREAELAARALLVDTQASLVAVELDKLAALRSAWRASAVEFESHLEAACGSLLTLERQRGLDRAQAALVECGAAKDEASARATESRRARDADQRFRAAEASGRTAAARDAERTSGDTADRIAAQKATEKAARAARDQVAEAGRVAQLSRILKKMRADDAARLIAEQPDATALEVLASLGDRASAKILASMRPDRSAALTQRLVKGAP